MEPTSLPERQAAPGSAHHPTTESPSGVAPAVQRRCIMVGIGASAGGLEPVGALLHGLAPDTGLAIIVVMHLDPTHESGLAAILARTTDLTVQVATDGSPIDAGHVYVIPPDANLAVRAGRLYLTRRAAEAGLHLPIDALFRSLADDAPGRCMGVVLSGTGSDGALGIQAIRAVGGVTFAQDGTAAHVGMPQAAIATGCIDFVLPPASIARNVVQMRSFVSVDDEAQPGEDPLLQQVFALVRAAGGVDFASYKQSGVRRRIQRRVQITRHEGLREYVEFLRVDAAEVALLSEDILIHVTRFFRDADVFNALREVVFARLVERRPRTAPLRIWVPGCSTGEELYSIAIVLLEFLESVGVSLPIRLFGTDVSGVSVERARAGRYVQNIAADVSPERLQRFFTKSEGSYQVRRDVRDLCVFARHDVTRDPSFSGMDVVSCRNLLIYLDAPLQQRVLQTFHYALKSDGLLLLGASETVGAFAGFAAIRPTARIFARTGPPTRLPHDPRPWADYVPGAPLRDPSALHQASISREAERAVVNAHEPPGVVVADDRSVVLFRGDTGRYLAPAPGAASLDVLRLVRADLRLALRQCLDETARTGVVARALAEGTSERSPGGVEVEVFPFVAPPSPDRLRVVFFREVSPGAARAVAAGAAGDGDPTLRHELPSTREYLQSIITQLEANNEELGVANEEAVSHNEELHSTNEEFQLAKEELQASNEELATVNGELLERNAEATRLNDDLINLFATVAIPIVILGRDGDIRRFTPAAGRVLGVIATDLGRPFSDLRPRLQGPSLMQVIAEVQSSLAPQEHAVRDEHGRWYQLAVRPYLMATGRVDGVTITLFDLDAIKREEGAREQDYQAKLQRASFDAVLAEERERRRLATELHDRVGQSLAFLQIRLSSICARLTGDSRNAIDECAQFVAQAINETRTLTFELSPPILYDLGLDAAVAWLSDQFAARHHLAVEVQGAGTGALGEDVAAVLFRAVRELLANVVKHSRCDRATVTLGRANGQLVITVEDTGVGIDSPPLAPHDAFGLFSVREQVSRLGGTFDLVSSVGVGTRVTLCVPPGEPRLDAAPEQEKP
jgi:two-component system CheB/CheR fusion protein